LNDSNNKHKYSSIALLIIGVIMIFVTIASAIDGFGNKDVLAKFTLGGVIGNSSIIDDLNGSFINTSKICTSTNGLCGSSSNITNNITNNITYYVNNTFNITNNITYFNNVTNNFTTNISYSSTQCADTVSKKMVNVTITNNVLSSVCTDDVTGGSDFNKSNYFNITTDYLNDTLSYVPISKNLTIDNLVTNVSNLNSWNGTQATAISNLNSTKLQNNTVVSFTSVNVTAFIQFPITKPTTLIAGIAFYNVTQRQLCIYNGTAWNNSTKQVC
jgi:hypothetical protein